jgi:hypothetical protein
MNNLSRTLLLVGALVLALLVGLLIGRSQRATPIADGNAAAVQINTAEPPMQPAPTPLPAPVQTPQPVAVPRIAPDQQVQEDAAAVGMTTRDGADQGSGDAAPAQKGAATTPDVGQSSPPNG